MRVVLGMSGGIDSSVAAILLQKQGYEVFGYTFVTGDDEEKQGLLGLTDASQHRGAEIIDHVGDHTHEVDLQIGGGVGNDVLRSVHRPQQRFRSKKTARS